MATKARRTESASEIESFLDNNEDYVGRSLFEELERIGDYLEFREEQFIDEIAVLKGKIEDLEEKLDHANSSLDDANEVIEELKSELEGVN